MEVVSTYLFLHISFYGKIFTCLEFIDYISYIQNEKIFIIDTVDNAFWVCC